MASILMPHSAVPRLPLLLLTILLAATSVAPPRAQTPPAAAQAAGEARWHRIDELIDEAIRDNKLHGAVVLVGQRDRVLYEKAFGFRAIEPQREPMTLDTIFDAASLTKVVATTTSAMLLLEQGKLRLSDRVATYVPGFERYGKQDITIRHLMTHMSGLRPDIDWSFEWQGYDKAIELAIEEVPVAAPNERFIYSDINYFLLGHIIAKITGTSLKAFAEANVFKPLGMTDTMFLPPESLRPRIAPTERCTPLGYPCTPPTQTSQPGSTQAAAQASQPANQPGQTVMLRGVVHDPTARRMGGVAGHAGLFTDAHDLAIFCRMLLGGGTTNGVRILSPLTVAKMTSPATPRGERNERGLGWDIDSGFSSNRGELFPLGSFGHTGFTGTSLWLDPTTGAYVIFLSSRVHPDGKGDVTPLRAKVATVAAAALADLSPTSGSAESLLTRARELAMTGRDFGPGSGAAPAAAREPAPVMTGIDVLRAEGFARLKGHRVGLVTNQTGRARDGSTTIDLLHEAKDVQLVALFSPEHGIRGVLDANVDSTRDEKTGLTIHSLYGDTRRPTDAMLQGIDTLVIDLQNIGARFWTYESTMANVVEEAAKRKLDVMVLDRPNPINGFQIEGPTLDRENLTFVGSFPLPTRHGMTLGELARLFNGENKWGAKLTVVEAQHWRRDEWFDETGLPWINPSPNMRNLVQATLYPGIGSIEGTNISVGRGTDTPFEQIGAPWINGVELAQTLNARHLPGITFYPVLFTPTATKYVNEPCQGVFMVVTDRNALRPVRVGLEIAAALVRLYRAQYKIEPTDRLVGSHTSITRILNGDDPADVAASWAADEAKWRLLRAKYLIYR
jgi:uncharacterized protein YbbC (DUF1343 family)/CubicO group peptidase (beta-lactamase class C family)